MSGRNLPRAFRPRSLRPITALVAAGLLLAPLTACSMSAPGAGSLPATAPLVGDASPQAVERSYDLDAAGASDASAAEKSVISTGYLTIEVSDPREAADEATAAAERLGGSVESLSVSHQGEGSSAELALRIPADRLDEAFDALDEIGSVQSETRSAVDVTAQHVDLEARVGALEKSVQRLEELMSDAASTSDLLEAESMLSQRQQELDGLRAQLQALEGQVAEATVHVTLTTKSALPGGGPANFWEGLLAGFASLGAAGSGALVVLGILLPWLTVAGIVAVLVVLLVRTVRSRRRDRAAARARDAAAPAPDGAARSADPSPRPPVGDPSPPAQPPYGGPMV